MISLLCKKKNIPPPQDISLSFFAFQKTILELSPHHLIDDAGVALDDLHDLGRDIFFDIVRHRNSIIAVCIHRDGGIDSLQKGLFVDSRNKEAGLVKSFGAFRAGADADCREGMANAREEGAFFGECAAVTHDGESTLADAIMDRISFDSYKINIEYIDKSVDKSMREVYGLTPSEAQ